MKILFVQDSAINESLALTDLAALLRAGGHECELLIEKEERDIRAEAGRMSPDLAVIPCSIGAHRFALETAEWVKESLGIPVVFGGSHATFFPEIISEGKADAVAIGECELSVAEYAEKIERGKDVRRTRGMLIKEGGKIYRNRLRPLASLDELPPPDRSIYFRYRFMRDIEMKRFISGRGCPNSCSYCFNPSLRKRYQEIGCGAYTRKKSVERVIEEISWMRENAALKHVHFSDDLFTFSHEWVKEFCKAYEGIGIPFTFNPTAEQLNGEIIGAVAKAGCSGIAMGVESGVERIRRLVLNKRISNEQIIRAAGLIRAAGIPLTTFNIIANPGETIEEAFETMKLNQKIRADNPRVTVCFPIPQTQLYDYAAKGGYLDEKEFMGKYEVSLDPGKMMLKTPEAERFENLFYLFRLGCKHPELTGLIRRAIRLPRSGFLRLATSLWPLYEKDFFGLSLLSGFKYYLHAGNPYLRTTNYTSLI